jgi:hypothetical protein
MLLRIEHKIHYTLRVAAAMCFIGHGSFGIITKPIWCNYFAVLGIAKQMAFALMPWLGSFDILCGLVLLFYPVRAIPLWLVIWGLITASLRPLSGEPFAELIERAGNYGAPLALLILSGGFNRNIFSRIDPDESVSYKSLHHTKVFLQMIVFFLLVGHGWLNIIEKKSLIQQYTSLGFSNPQNTAIVVGILEIIAAITLLVSPIRPLVFLLILWKIGSEFFYPHYELFEWVERGGSYGCLIALWFSSTAISYRNLSNRVPITSNFLRKGAARS